MKAEICNAWVVSGALVGILLVIGAPLVLLYAQLSSSALWRDDVPLDDGRRVRACFFFASFAMCACFTAVIPESLSMAERWDRGPTYSGWLVSSMMGGGCIGYIGMWAFSKLSQDATGKFYRPILIACCFVMALCTFVGALLSVSSLVSAAGLALIIRACMGACNGAVTLSARIVLRRISTAQEAPHMMALHTFWAMMGIGLGPVIAALAMLVFTVTSQSFGAGCGMSSPGLEFAGSAGSLASIVIAGAQTAVFFGFPSRQDPGEKQQRLLDEDETAPTEATLSEKIAIVACVFACAPRAMVIAGLEVATAMILEVHYGWSTHEIGLAIGGCFLCCIPQQIVYNQFKDRISPIAWFRIFMALTVVGVALFHEGFSALVFPGSLVGRVVILLLANCILFPCFFLASGISEGLAYGLACREGGGSIFVMSNIALWASLSIDCVGRLLGPPAARWHIHRAGQSGYAWQQLVLTLLAWVVTELFVLPATQRTLTESEPIAREGEKKVA